MMRIRIAVMKRVAVAVAGLGILTQVGGCDLTQLQPLADLTVRQVANVVADTAFFVFDNFLVRLTG